MTGDISIDSTRIEADMDFEASVDFSVPAKDSSAVQGLEYVISLHAESLGSNPNRMLGTRQGTLSAGRIGYAAPDTTINVEAGTLQPGPYRLASTLVIKDSPPLAGYIEGPIIQVI